MSKETKPRNNLTAKKYSLAEAFGMEWPTDKYVMGFEPSPCRYVPSQDRYYKWDRTLLRDLIMWWDEGDGDPIFAFGPSGSGKSAAFRNFCAALHIPCYEKTFYPGLELNDLITVVDLNEGSTITSYSHLPLAMGAEGWPGIFVANELDRGDPGTVVGLNEVLQRQPLLVQLGGLQPVKPQPEFRVAATGNSALAGDMEGTYVSVRQQDDSTADRFWLVHVSYPSPPVEEEVLNSVAPLLPQTLRSKMIEVANDIRQAYMGGSQSAAALPLTMSTRALARWARQTWLYRGAQSQSLNPVAYALDRAFLNRAHQRPEVRKAILKIVEGRLGDAHGAFA